MQLLKETLELTEEPKARRHIESAIAYADTPTSGHNYQRGKPLVDMLKAAAEAVTDTRDADVRRRLEAFAEYAAGQIALSLLETWFVPGRGERDDDLMRQMLSLGFRRGVEVLDGFLKDHPTATAREACDFLEKLAGRMDRLRVGRDPRGGVKLPRHTADTLTWLSRVQLVLDEDLEHTAIPAELVDEIASMPGVDLVTQAVRLRRRRDALARLRAIVEDPASAEADIHAELKQQTWIFGGRYVKELERRRLTVFDEIDIPLLRGDGALHIVELKKAFTPKLVERHRSHCVTGFDVHRAVMQTANYLRSLDENRATVPADHGIECRRSFATVLIGHPMFVAGSFSPEEITAALRTHNAELSRIEVITYEDLLDSAERTLTLDGSLT